MVIEALWEQLGLKKTLQDVEKAAGTQVPYERALLAMVANRLCAPESKLGVWDRLLDQPAGGRTIGHQHPHRPATPHQYP
jgi:hypothetical protein